MTIPSVRSCVSVIWEKTFSVRSLSVLREMHVTPELPFTAMRRHFTKPTEVRASAIPDLLFAQSHVKVSRCIKNESNTPTSLLMFIFCIYQIAKNIIISDVELNLPQGVYLFLGYSEKDEKLLKAVTDQGAEEARGAIQGMVSFHNVNSNKVDIIKGFI